MGSGCRFPGSSSSPSSLSKLLEKPRDVSKEIPNERFELQGYYHTKGSHHGTTNVQRSYTLDEDVRIFDAKLFDISPNEADSMDPQQRLLMEAVYEALEAGGHPVESLRGADTAVFIGTMSVDYNDIISHLLCDWHFPRYSLEPNILLLRLAWAVHDYRHSLLLEYGCLASVRSVFACGRVGCSNCWRHRVTLRASLVSVIKRDVMS